METINEITFEKLKKIDYEILRLEKALPPWQLMAEIWSLKKQLDCVIVNGEIVPDTDWTPEIDNLLLDNTPVLGEYHYAIHQSIVEKERLLQEAGFTLSRYADVLFQIEYIREELKRLHNIRRKDFEETLAVHGTQKTACVLETKTNESITNDTVFFDEETEYLWLDSNKKEKIEPEDAKILKAIIGIFTSNNRSACRIEEVCLNAFNIKLSTQDKISNDPTYKKYRSAASAINNKCRKLLKTNDKNHKLIRAEGNRNIKLSKNVVFRNMYRKQT